MVKDDDHWILRLGSALGLSTLDLKIIFACNLVGSFGDGLYAFLLPVYMIRALNASSVEVGVLYAVNSLLAASTLFLAGSLADKYDRKKIMIAGWVAWLPVPLIFAFAQNWIQMLPGMVLWGFWLGTPTGTAYIVATADKHRLTLTFSTISAAWSLGYIVSPAVGGYLAGTVGMRSVFFLSTLLYGVACLFLTFLRSQHAARNESPATYKQYTFLKLLRTRKLLKLSLLFASMLFAVMMFRPFLPTFLTEVYHYDDSQIGVLGSVTFASSAILGIMLGKLGDRTKKTYAVSASLIFCCSALGLLLLFSSYPILVFAFFLFGGSYLTWSLLSATVGPLAPEACSARWISVPQTVSMFSSIMAPYVAGMLYAFSPIYPFLTALVIAGLLVAITLTRVFDERIGAEDLR